MLCVNRAKKDGTEGPAGAGGALRVYHQPRSPPLASRPEPWVLVAAPSESEIYFPGDTRVSVLYVPRKPEPLIMATSAQARLTRLYSLNLTDWFTAKIEGRQHQPQIPILEQLSALKMEDNDPRWWPATLKAVQDMSAAERGWPTTSTPVDCTADLPVSAHPWM